VRHTIIRLIGDHLRPQAAVSWQGLDLDFTGVVFDGGDFTKTEFSGGQVRFDGAQFSGGQVGFDGAQFSGGQVRFVSAGFYGAAVSFVRAVFSGGEVSFVDATFWSQPPVFDWDGKAPAGVTLPTGADTVS
jgi:uncharacterized protein YjbI with pentapeptide repeats